MTQKSSNRLHFLDTFRGFLMINMIAYHGMWDMVNLFGVRAGWYSGLTKYTWQQFICWSFILLSGFCWRLSRNHLRRGGLVFGGGVIVSLVTNILMPENRIIFGILTCTGSCVLLMTLLEKPMKKVPAEIGAGVSFLLFLLLRNVGQGSLGFENFVLAPLPELLYRNDLTAYLDFPYPEFFSTDYFGLIPWIFLFITGFFLSRVLDQRKLTAKLFSRGRVPVLGWIGRNSLLVYLLHQPVLYGMCMLGQLLLLR